MATARAAVGTLLQRNNVSIALISDIEGPGLKGDTIDTTNHNNPDSYKQYIIGLLEGGDVKLKIFFDPLESTHTDLIAAHQSRTVDTYGITYPVTGSGSWSFSACITQYDVKAKVNAALEVDITLKVSGKPNFA